jgi:hypothetical protein
MKAWSPIGMTTTDAIGIQYIEDEAYARIHIPYPESWRAFKICLLGSVIETRVTRPAKSR